MTFVLKKLIFLLIGNMSHNVNKKLKMKRLIEGFAWKRLFHPYHGPCYTFDLSKIEQFKYLQYTSIFQTIGGKPGIEIVMAEDTLWQTIYIIRIPCMIR